MLTEEDLQELEEKALSLMTAGHWMDGIQAIRDAAALHEESSDDLTKRIASRAIQRGRLKPLPMVTSD